MYQHTCPPSCTCPRSEPLPTKYAKRKKLPKAKTYEPFKTVTYDPCVHLHFKSETPDRECLTHEQYLDMLATPKGYPWLGEADCQNPDLEAERPKKKKKKKKQPTEVCCILGPEAGGDFADEFVEDMWDVMSPEITCRLIEFLVNEFGMSYEEAEDFIDCKGCTGKQTVCKKKKPKFGYGPKSKWVTDFSNVFAKRIEQYIIGMLLTKRTPRVKKIAERILLTMCDLTGEKTTLQTPRTKIQRIMVLIADRLALWIDDLMRNIDKPVKEPITLTEEDEDEEEEEEEEEEPKEEGEKEKEEKKEEEEKKGDKGKEKKPDRKPKEEEKPAQQEDQKEEESDQKDEEEKPEEEKGKQEEEKEKQEEEKEKQDEDAASEEPQPPAAEPVQEEPPPPDPAEQEEEPEPEKQPPPQQEEPKAEEQPAEVEETPAEEPGTDEPVEEQPAETEAEGENREEITEEEKPEEPIKGGEQEEVKAEEATGEEEKPDEEEKPVEDEQPVEKEVTEEEKPAVEEEVEGEEPEQEEEEPEKKKDLFGLIMEDIEGTRKDKKTDREKALKDAVGKRVEKILAYKPMEVDEDDFDDATSRVAHWMDSILGATEKKPAHPKGPGAAFEVKPKTGSTLQIHKLSSGTVAETTAKVRGVAPPPRERKIPESESPMNVKSTPEWVDWVSDVASVANEWDKWLETLLTGAEKNLADRKKEGSSEDKMSYWKEWRNKAEIEAQKWRVEKGRMVTEGDLWSAKLDKKPPKKSTQSEDDPEREVRSTDM